MKKIIPFLLLLAAGCGHDHDDPSPEEVDITFNISKPTENQSFAFGDTIFFKSTIQADAELHGWGISLKRKGDDSLVYSWTNHYHTTSYDINQYWVNTLRQDTAVVFQLDAAINHQGDLKSKLLVIRTRKP